MNNRGQILLPGLAIYLMLVTFFFLTIASARRTLARMRLETAATATALSAARAMAVQLNNRVAYNGTLNAFLTLSYHGHAAMLKAEQPELQAYLDVQKMGDFATNVLNGSLGGVGSVASQVAKLNGATFNTRITVPTLKLEAEDLTVYFLMPHPPFVEPHTYANAYWSRIWGRDARRAQPDHEVVWLVGRDGMREVAGARLYLDVDRYEYWQNGGFPRHEGESFFGNLGLQPFYPQFNARLIPTPLPYRVLQK